MRRSRRPAGSRRRGLTALDTQRVSYGTERWTILTHSPELHASQAAGFDGATLAKAGKKLGDLAATLARGKTRRPREKVEAEIETITRKPWVRRVATWRLDGQQPKDLRLTWHADPRRPGRRNLRQARPDHRPRRLACARGDRRLPVSVRSRVLLPADERHPRRVVLPDAPLDRAQHPRPPLHLRARPADRPPDAPEGPPRRAGPVGARPAGRACRHRRDRPALPRRPGAAQSPPHAHRHQPSPGQAQPHLRPPALRPQAPTWVI